MQGEILKYLRSKQGSFLSGEEIAESLQVSRAAIWKAVEELREKGYAIDASPSKGYALTAVPDRLLPEEIQARLKARQFGKEIHYLPVTESTNTDAMERAKAGGLEGEVFITEKQTSGRGRMGRTWESPEGKNLALSFLLRPEIKPAQGLPITLVAAVALHEALSNLLPAAQQGNLKIKWPNDLYIGDKKVAGILTEMESDQDQIHWIICGIGVDLNAVESDFSEPVGKIATSIRIATGRAVDRIGATASLIDSFEKCYQTFLSEGAASTIAFCDEHSYLRGKKVSAQGAEGPVQGTVSGLDKDGFLLVKSPTGPIVTIRSGDVSVLR